jgi:hypothetical protein
VLVGWCWSRWGAHIIKHKPTTTTMIIVVVVIPCSSLSSLAPHCHPSSLVCVRSWALAVVNGPRWVVMGVGGRLYAFIFVSGRSSSFWGGCLQSWSVGVDVVAARMLAVGVVFRLWPQCHGVIDVVVVVLVEERE